MRKYKRKFFGAHTVQLLGNLGCVNTCMSTVLTAVRQPFSLRKPLVSFDTCGRASLARVAALQPMPSRRAGSAVVRRRSRRRAAVGKRSSKVRVVKGRVQLRVKGHKGVQNIAPSHLVRHVPVTKLREAAHKLLKLSSHRRGKALSSRLGGRRRRRRRGKVSKKKSSRSRRRRRRRHI